jgi:hypothetical protein
MAARKLIKLSPEVRQGISARMQLIAQKELELSLFRNELSAFIQQSTGADLNKQDWTLDLEHSLLERN